MNEKKTAYPILGIILGVLGAAVALLLSITAGIISGIVAGLLGLAAVLLGVFALKRGRKTGGILSIVAGVLAIILAVVAIIGSVAMFNEAKEKAQNNPNTPLAAKYLKNPSLGLIGFLNSIPKDDAAAKADLETLQKELDILNGKIEVPAAPETPAEAETPAATDAPVDAPAEAEAPAVTDAPVEAPAPTPAA